MGILEDFRRYTLPHLWKEDEPFCRDPIKYDPMFGFENREQKRPKATEEEMRSCSLEPMIRNECAHLQIAYRTCMKTNEPFWWRCNGYANEIKLCSFEQRVSDMKEFERERRLNARERRLRTGSAK